MGAYQSMLRERGLQAMNNISINKVYDKYFIRKEIQQFEDFHVAFIDLCKDLTSILLGTQYAIPSSKEVEGFYIEWINITEEEKKKIRFCDFINKNVVYSNTNQRATFVTGMVAPATAVVVKKTWKNIPILNIIPIHVIPTLFFVPSFTLLSLIGIKAVHLGNGSTT